MWSPKSQTLRVGLSTQHLMLVKAEGMWSRTPASCARIECEPAAQAEPWRPVVKALAGVLAAQSPTKITLHIVLSGRFVRWQLLPWRAGLTQSSELTAYASLRFREIFGKAAEDWQMLYAPQPPGTTMPACAIDVALMDALRSTCETAGARLAAVTPYFSSAFDQWRRSLGGKSAWFGLIESDCISLGLLQGGRWAGLHTQRLDGDWRRILPGMMAQMGIAAGLTESSPPLYLAGSEEAPQPVEDLPFMWLKPKPRSGQSMVGHRLALGV